MEGKKNKILVFVLITIIVLLGIYLGYYEIYLKKDLDNKNNVNDKNTTTTTEIIVPKNQEQIEEENNDYMGYKKLFPKTDVEFVLLRDIFETDEYKSFLTQDFKNLQIDRKNMTFLVNCSNFSHGKCNEYNVVIDNLISYTEYSPINVSYKEMLVLKTNKYYILVDDSSSFHLYDYFYVYSLNGILLGKYLNINSIYNINTPIINNNKLFIVTIDKNQTDNYFKSEYQEKEFEYFIKSIDLDNELKENVLASFKSSNLNCNRLD